MLLESGDKTAGCEALERNERKEGKSGAGSEYEVRMKAANSTALGGLHTGLRPQNEEGDTRLWLSCLDRIGFDERDVDFAADGAGVAEERVDGRVAVLAGFDAAQGRSVDRCGF